MEKNELNQNEEETMDEERPWPDLPLDILELIASRVPLSKHRCLALICKNWSHVASRAYLADKSPLLLSFKKRKGDTFCHYYSPFNQKVFSMKCPLSLHDTKLLASKNGWLLLNRGATEIFLFNVFSWDVRQLPPLKERCGMDGFAFSGHPTSPDCMIFFLQSEFDDCVQVSLYRGGQWSPFEFFNNEDENFEDVNFEFTYSNPVFCQGRFFCLGVKGDVGVFNPNNNTWFVITPKQRLRFGKDRAFLIESQGQLLSVLISKHGSPIHVYRLNKSPTNWEKVKSLNNWMFFVGNPASTLMIAPVREMEGKIYTEWFRGHPEIVEVHLKRSGGEMYFVSERVSSTKAGQGKKYSNEDNIYFTLESKIDERDYFRHRSSIWVDPVFVE